MVRTRAKGSVGAATVNITPRGPLPGYFGNVFRRGQPDTDLLAHAVVFSDGLQTCAVVGTDLLLIGRPEILWIKELCELRTGIPARNIFISANHNHSAPACAPAWRSGNQPDPFYTDDFVHRVTDAVVTASQSMKPALFVAGQAAAPGIAFNRRLLRPDGTVVHVACLQQSPAANDLKPDYPPEGPVDNEVGYIFFEQPDGAPIAGIMSFACHNHSASAATFHRNMFGRAVDTIQARLGQAIPVAFLAGACGDIMWVDPGRPLPEDSEAFTWQVGARLADAVIQHREGRTRRQIEDVRVASLTFEVPDRPLEQSEFCEDNCRGHDKKAWDFVQQRYGPERLVLMDRGRTECLVETGAVSIAREAAISTNPAELFVEFGLEIKRRSPFPVTLISELTNGYCGYVPTEAAFEHGGYETHRGVYASRLDRNGGRIITERSVEALEKCADAPVMKAAVGRAKARGSGVRASRFHQLEGSAR